MTDHPEARPPEDPSGIEEPHDVLAAEEFALPAPSPGEIPPDPAGIQEPHDVLAAEEFPMPAGGSDADAGGAIEPRSLAPIAALALLALVLLRRRRRRR